MSIISGRVRNIYFSFDIETDTALSVAMEMISELDITDQDVTKIAEMIDGEIANLVPGWKRGLYTEESPNYANDHREFRRANCGSKAKHALGWVMALIFHCTVLCSVLQ